MGIALVFNNADFSENAVEQVQYDEGIVWTDVDLSNITNKNVGFVWGETGSPQGKVETSTSWGAMFAYTDAIQIPEGTIYIQGMSSAIDLNNRTGGGYQSFPAVVFYGDNSAYISEVDGGDFSPLTESIYNSEAEFKTKGYEGAFTVAVPEGAKSLRIQWIFGTVSSSATAEKIGDITAIQITEATLKFGHE